MMPSPYQVADRPSALGLSCTAEGLELAGVKLLDREAGRFVPRLPAQIAKLLHTAYGTGPERGVGIMGGLQAVANALNEQALARAMVAAVFLKLPDVPWPNAIRMTLVDDVFAKNFTGDPNADEHWKDEPRNDDGNWTTGGGNSRLHRAGFTQVASAVDESSPGSGPRPLDMNEKIRIELGEETSFEDMEYGLPIKIEPPSASGVPNGPIRSGSPPTVGKPAESQRSTPHSRDDNSETQNPIKDSTKQISINNKAGKGFEKELENALTEGGFKFGKQITVEANTENKERCQFDFLVQMLDESLISVEAKASATARLSNRQADAHPAIWEHGGTVVGEGKLGFPGGMAIPPNTVQVWRPNDIPLWLKEIMNSCR